MLIEMETALAETIESSKWITHNMTPEIYFLGFAVSIFSVLIGAIWKMLHNKIDSNQKAMLAMHKETEKALKDSIRELSASLNARAAENHNTLSQRLSNGSNRMDGFSQELAGVRVKLAEEYHTAAETRILIGDLMGPITKQLDRLEYLMIDKRKGENA